MMVNRRKSTLGRRPRATPLSPPVRMLMMNSSRRSPRLGTLGLTSSSIQKSGQKSSSKKVRLFDRLRESHAPSQLKQPQKINHETNHVSKAAPKKSVSRRLDMKPDLPKIQPPQNCSMDSTARFEKDEAFVVTSTPAIKAITPFGAVKTLVEAQTPKSESVATGSEALQKQTKALLKLNERLEEQNHILEKILQGQQAQTEIMKKFFEGKTGSETHHEASSHPLSPSKLHPCENAPWKSGTPVGKENSKLCAMKARKPNPGCSLLGISTPNMAKATPRTKHMYRRAQEQLNLLSDA